MPNLPLPLHPYRPEMSARRRRNRPSWTGRSSRDVHSDGTQISFPRFVYTVLYYRGGGGSGVFVSAYGTLSADDLVLVRRETNPTRWGSRLNGFNNELEKRRFCLNIFVEESDTDTLTLIRAVCARTSSGVNLLHACAVCKNWVRGKCSIVHHSQARHVGHSMFVYNYTILTNKKTSDQLFTPPKIVCIPILYRG